MSSYLPACAGLGSNHCSRASDYDLRVLCCEATPNTVRWSGGVGARSADGLPASLLGLGTGLWCEHHAGHRVQGDAGPVGAVADHFGQVEALHDPGQVPGPELGLGQASLGNQEVGVGGRASEVVGRGAAEATCGQVGYAAFSLAAKPLGHDGLAKLADGGGGGQDGPTVGDGGSGGGGQNHGRQRGLGGRCGGGGGRGGHGEVPFGARGDCDCERFALTRTPAAPGVRTNSQAQNPI